MGNWNNPIIAPASPLSSLIPNMIANLALAKIQHNWQMDIADKNLQAQQIATQQKMQFEKEKIGLQGQEARKTETTKAALKPTVLSPGQKAVDIGGTEIASGGPKTPTTAMGAFLQQNPYASPDQIVAYAQQLKGKGFKMTMPDGTVVEMGGGQGGLTPAATTNVQKETADLMQQLGDFQSLKSAVFKDALTLQGKLKAGALRLADWANFDIGAENKKYLGNTRVFIEKIEQIFNAYRQEITGAQAGMREIAMLRDSILNKKMTPTEFEYSINSFEDRIKRGLRIKRMLLRQGVQPSTPEFGMQFDKIYMPGGDVNTQEIDARGDELKSSGMTDKEVIKQLRQEGYL